MRRTPIIAAFTLVAAACVSAGTGPSTTGGDTTTGGTNANGSTTLTTEDLRPCKASIPDVPPSSANGPSAERITGSNVEAASVSISQGAFICAHDVVVVSASDLDRVAIAARLAVGLNAPLLFATADGSSLLAYEIDRLSPKTVWMVGDGTAVAAPEFSDVKKITGTNDRIAAEVNDEVEASSEVTLPEVPGIATVVTAIEGFADGLGVIPSPTTTTTTTTTTDTSAGDTTTTTTTTTTVPPSGDSSASEEVPSVYAGVGTSGTVWLVDVGQTELAIAAAVSATTTGGLMALVDGADLRANPAVARTIRLVPGGAQRVQLIGVTPDSTWQLPVILEGEENPGGGYLMFPGRRLVAIYGNPQAGDLLGILGEQDPEASASRARQVAAGYDADGLVVVPSFEIIVTVAAADAGSDGNYSNEMPLDILQPWIDVAAEQGLYVLLDLQPGRSDFLAQAKLYEDFLKLPNVGLALDPEWRLGPNELPLRQIGHVSAEEVNSVVEWLAALVRDNHLPQKVLLLHQFRLSMLENRELIETPSELATVIQMDGQGAIPDKYSTWSAITQGWETASWSYGWKNFYDEDSPGPISPAEVLDLVPIVVYVSYQ